MRISLLTALLLLAATGVPAHDFWIEPSTFRPTPGTTVAASLRVGVDFAGDPVPRSTQLFETFVARDAKGTKDVVGFEGRDPAGYVRVENPGVTIVGYRSKANPLELPAEKFEQYLRDEGLESIIAWRASHGQSKTPGHELFFRFAKSIIGAGTAPNTNFGYRFELIPESDTQFRVLHEGKPIANILVIALHRDDPTARFRARSDRNGRVKLPLAKNGVWLVKAVHMVPAPAGTNADWESLWASVTFER
ncbi:MAG TPA: DUF4198 domain-containing protein [Thermoanaerobaculia bacterium]|nr:DUF4198 domain-containing protein [Thermoanaerobaculia bacterium]